ncbi:PilN domain-containing protein [Idiomarina aquatica]|uniref:Tfp pilus assembly protein PilN n=1 Tax=Idiomarina aquatica TaxID=1327752 RepID=A0AA94JE28_9GAMM|nr:PilN domain-containing protein [Idiomarina aquatica]RUO45407.1 hypothetical protein CWE23_05220 [Idiomarina aquatica]
MKQSINLLRDELKPIVQRLSLNRLALVTLVLAVCVLAAVLYTSQLQQQSRQALAQLEEQLAQQKQRREQLQQQLEQRSPSPALTEQEQALEAAIAAQQQLNQQLAAQQSERQIAPDQLMQELSQVNIDGLWLTEFSITPDGVSLSGKMIRANLLPRWMQRFQSMPLLSQSHFAVVDLDRNEQQQQTFSLNNQQSPSNGDTVSYGAPATGTK